MIKESIFLFLAVGMVMPYLLSGTANGEYVVVNLNSTWDGEHVVLTGKVNVYNPILNKTFPGGFNKRLIAHTLHFGAQNSQGLI
ncbi:hypothetical protein [Sulfuracidifex metallicus]|uniref:hypothetical protein n=1 Tax=Sulfuracidifex metallicus TaxID=47303 RepID=UPI0006D000C0|nr:hypothetical protein [Sulfuracidifex metallicus]